MKESETFLVLVFQAEEIDCVGFASVRVLKEKSSCLTSHAKEVSLNGRENPVGGNERTRRRWRRRGDHR